LKRYATIALLLAALVLAAGCAETGDDAEAWNESLAADAADRSGSADPHAADRPASAAAGTAGRVVETFDAGGYTYVRLQTPQGEIWAAGPVSRVAEGDEVSLAGGMIMRGFRSPSLDRTFDEIWFLSSFGPAGDPADAAAGSGPRPSHHETGSAVDLMEPPTGGISVAALHADRKELDGRRVKLRGRVVKFLDGIMDRNWLHLRDGSGDAAGGDNDVTVTTDGTARVGDTVVVEGTVAVDRDFGSGYFYIVIVEDAVVTVEQAL